MERVFAITCIRNEKDIIPFTIRQMFREGVDGMIVNLSKYSNDGTRSIVVKLAQEFNMAIVQDDEKNFFYHQDEITTRLAAAAHALGATWIVPFDADEMFYSTNDVPFAEQLRGHSINCFALRMKNYHPTSHDDAKDKNPLTRIQWRKTEWNPLNKVCFRWNPDIFVAVGNHHVSSNGRWITESLLTSAEIGHFQNRTAEGMIRKIRQEQAQSNVPDDKGIGFHRKEYAMTDDEIRAWWEHDYYFANPEHQGLVYDPVPYIKEGVLV